MDENYILENDFFDESMSIYTKLNRRTIAVGFFYLVTFVSSMFEQYKDFDVIFTSNFFKVLLTISVLLTIFNIVISFQKHRFGEEKMYKIIKREKDIYDLVSVIPIFIAIVVFFNAFLISPAVVEGPSMEPNFEEGNTVLISHLSSIDRLDVIIIKVQEGSNYSYYIKRVIGLPGDTVTIENNHIYITNSSGTFVLDDVTLPNNALTTCLTGPGQDITDSCSFTLSSGEYFVLGDNRQLSTDSRSIGSIKQEDIYGEVIFTLPFLN